VVGTSLRFIPKLELKLTLSVNNHSTATKSKTRSFGIVSVDCLPYNQPWRMYRIKSRLGNVMHPHDIE